MVRVKGVRDAWHLSAPRCALILMLSISAAAAPRCGLLEVFSLSVPPLIKDMI